MFVGIARLISFNFILVQICVICLYYFFALQIDSLCVSLHQQCLEIYQWADLYQLYLSVL